MIQGRGKKQTHLQFIMPNDTISILYPVPCSIVIKMA